MTNHQKSWNIINIMTIHQKSWNIIRNHDKSSKSMIYHQKSWWIIKNHEISSKIMINHKKSWNLIKNHEISSEIMKYHRVWLLQLRGLAPGDRHITIVDTHVPRAGPDESNFETVPRDEKIVLRHFKTVANGFKNRFEGFSSQLLCWKLRCSRNNHPWGRKKRPSSGLVLQP